MAAIIFREDGDAWFTSRWCMHRLLADTMSQHRDEPDLRDELDLCEAAGGVTLFLLSDDLASRLVGAIKEVAQATVEGVMLPRMNRKDSLTEEDEQGYKRGLTRLLRMIEEEYPNV